MILNDRKLVSNIFELNFYITKKMDREFAALKRTIKGIQKTICEYPENRNFYINSIRNFLVCDLNNENKNEFMDKIILLNQFQVNLANMIKNYDKVTNEILNYISNVQFEITGNCSMKKDDE